MSREGSPKEWLRHAEMDQRAAKTLLASGEYEPCAFHCQQAVEKLLKAIIVQQTGQRPVHTHDLNALLRQVTGVELSVEITQAISTIDAYYVGSRYPLDAVDPGVFKRPLAESVAQRTDEIFQWFLAKISFESE